jgi:riboflavin synthase
MFTGIVRHLGEVVRLAKSAGVTQLVVRAGALADEASHGDSVCVSGVCLTVVETNGDEIVFDVIAETLRLTHLGALGVGDRVNLERSLRVGETIDGHFVQGHVDGQATVQRIDRSDGQHEIWFEGDEGIRPFIVPKGGVAIDGVSLTIAAVRENLFSVALIPTTLSCTTMGALTPGSRVNIETDILVRTVVHHLQSMGGGSGLSMDALRAEGFA